MITIHNITETGQEVPAVPTVHLNGTSKEALLEQVSKAAAGVQDAISASQAAMPHGRDYYVQALSEGPYGTPLRMATDQWADRIKRLADVYEELFTVWQGIYEQGRR